MAETVYDDDEGRSGEAGASENGERAGQEIQAPATLLPYVLHQLGLSEDLYQIEEPREIAVDDVVRNLSSDDWQVRVAAVRRLGRLGERVPVELLDDALDDEDSAVRAAAVRVLGCAGKRAPLPRLVAALHDADWHVRETAVLVLGNCWQDIPDEELHGALYDEDGLVRQAAQLALQMNNEKKTNDSYGRLWEQKSMQERQEPVLQKKEGSDPFETLLDAQKQAMNESGYHEYAHTLHEQTQTYAPQEQFAYEHGARGSEHWEKVTNLPARKSHKGWWGIVAATAILFFVLGSGVTRMTEPGRLSVPLIIHKEMSKPAGDFTFDNPESALLIQNEVSSALKMSPDSIRTQLKEGRSLSDIAAAQDVPEDQLQKVELQSLTDAEKAMPEPDNGQAQKMIGALETNPQVLDKLVTNAFLTQAG